MPRRWSASATAIVEAAVTVDIVDVGGGFPSSYPGMEPPPLETYFEVIHAGVRSAADQLFGRAVVRAGPRAVRRICQRARARRKAPRRRALHQRRRLWRAVRCRAHRLALSRCSLLREPESHVRPMEFSFYGPTCDDLDHMAGPFELPARRRGRRLYRDRHARRLWLRDAHPVQRLRRRTRPVIVDDEPMASLYATRVPADALERREAVAHSPLPSRGSGASRTADFGVRLSPAW